MLVLHHSVQRRRFQSWVLFVTAYTDGLFKTVENLFALLAFGFDTPLLAQWDVFITGCTAIVHTSEGVQLQMHH